MKQIQLTQEQRINVCGIVSDAHCQRCEARRGESPCIRRDEIISPDKAEIRTTREWIRERCFKPKSGSGKSGYGLKHLMEQENRIYVTNGEFITAALLEGYVMISIHSPNCNFNIEIKTDRNKRLWKGK